jgi:hypothetical protein
MKRKSNGKLALNKETLRTLSDRAMNGAYGGFSKTCTTEESNSVDTCDITCAGCTSGICTHVTVCNC